LGLRLYHKRKVIVKERSKGSPISAVPIIMTEKRIPIDDAVQIVIGLINDAVGSFEMSERSIKAKMVR